MHACATLQLATGAVLIAVFSAAGCAGKGGEPAAAPATTGAGAAATEESPSGEPAAPGGDDEEIPVGEEALAAAEEAPASKGDDKGGDKEERTTEVIQKIINDNRKPIRECYEKAKKDLPTLQGTMTIHFVLDPEGKMKKAELNQDRSDLKSPTVVKCAIEQLKKLSFPPSSRGMETTINYPFNFKP